MNQYSEKYVDQLEVQIAEQQAEIEALKESNKNLMELVTMLREEVNSLRQQQAEIEALKSRELTDEEIMELSYLTSDNDPIDFAKAILKKAQEK